MKRHVAIAILAALLAFPVRAGSFDDFNRGVNAFNRGDNDAAIVALTRALAAGRLMDSLKPAALIDRGIAYVREKRYVDAIPDLNVALDLSPGRDDATYARMLAYERTGQGPLAAADCDALIKMRPGEAGFYSQCGTIRWQNGDFARAIPYFSTAVGLPATPSAVDVLWLEITRLRTDAPDDPQFARLTRKLDLDGWPSPIFDLYLGKSTPEAVLSAAERDADPSTPSGFASLQLRRCQAFFFVAEWQLLQGNAAAARALLRETDAYCTDWLPAETEERRLAQR